MPINKTIARLYSASRNMLINPYFEGIDVNLAAANLNQDFLPVPHGDLFRFAPGWFPYGGAANGDYARPDTYTFSTIDNPFANNTSGERVNQAETTSDQRYGNGIIIEQESGKDFGIVQPILRGAALKRATKVRITGCYQILQNDGAGGIGSDVSGIHIYLKKELRAINIGTGKVAEAASTSSSVDANTLTSPGGTTWITDGVAIGDTLVVPNEGYFTITSVVSETNLDVTPNMTHPTGLEAGVYVLGPPSATTGRATEDGQRIVLPPETRFVAHLMPTDTDFLHADGEAGITGTEQLIRAYDFLAVAPGGNDAQYKHLVLGPSTALPGDRRGFRNPEVLTNFTAWILEDQVETSNGKGDVLFSSDDSVGGTVTPTEDLIFFDEIITLNETAPTSTQGEYFLIIQPVKPSLSASINGSVSIVIWGVSLQILDSAEEGESNLITEFTAGRRNSSVNMDGWPAKYLASYPIYIPTVLPLSVNFRQGHADTQDGNPVYATTKSSNKGVPQPPVFRFRDGENPDTVNEEIYIAEQVRYPPGLVVVGGGVPVEDRSATWSTNMNLRLIEGFCPPPYNDSDRYLGAFLTHEDSLGRLVAELDILPAAADSTVLRFDTVFRNKIGLYDGGADGEALVNLEQTNFQRMGASSLFFVMVTPLHNDTPSTSIIKLRDGWVYGVYDPRWGLASTHWD